MKSKDIEIANPREVKPSAAQGHSNIAQSERVQSREAERETKKLLKKMTTQNTDQTIATKTAKRSRLSVKGRNARVINTHGGTLIDMLLDEALRRGINSKAMAQEVGVTAGYINQLRNGLKRVEYITNKFACACSRFLGISPMSVKLAAGKVGFDDFLSPIESVESSIDRAMRNMLADPRIRLGVPSQLSALPLEAKRVVLEVYMQTTSIDVFELHALPIVLKGMKSQIEMQLHAQTRVAT